MNLFALHLLFFKLNAVPDVLRNWIDCEFNFFADVCNLLVEEHVPVWKFAAAKSPLRNVVNVDFVHLGVHQITILLVYRWNSTIFDPQRILWTQSSVPRERLLDGWGSNIVRKRKVRLWGRSRFVLGSLDDTCWVLLREALRFLLLIVWALFSRLILMVGILSLQFQVVGVFAKGGGWLMAWIREVSILGVFREVWCFAVFGEVFRSRKFKARFLILFGLLEVRMNRAFIRVLPRFWSIFLCRFEVDIFGFNFIL